MSPITPEIGGQPSSRQCACFYPHTHHEGSSGPAKSLMRLTELPVSPDLNPIKHPWDIVYCWIHCCHHTTATPAQTVQELTDVLIRVWEEIPRETISRLIRSVPGRGERVHHERSWLNSWMCYQPVISFFFCFDNERVCNKFNGTCNMSSFHRPHSHHMSVLTIKYTMLHLLCYF